jgi:hypothetical protein
VGVATGQVDIETLKLPCTERLIQRFDGGGRRVRDRRISAAETFRKSPNDIAAGRQPEQAVVTAIVGLYALNLVQDARAILIRDLCGHDVNMRGRISVGAEDASGNGGHRRHLHADAHRLGPFQGEVVPRASGTALSIFDRIEEPSRVRREKTVFARPHVREGELSGPIRLGMEDVAGIDGVGSGDESRAGVSACEDKRAQRRSRRSFDAPHLHIDATDRLARSHFHQNAFDGTDAWDLRTREQGEPRSENPKRDSQYCWSHATSLTHNATHRLARRAKPGAQESGLQQSQSPSR